MGRRTIKQLPPTFVPPVEKNKPIRLAEIHIPNELYFSLKFQRTLCDVLVRNCLRVGSETAFLLDGPQFEETPPREDGLYDPNLYELVEGKDRFTFRKVVDK